MSHTVKEMIMNLLHTLTLGLCTILLAACQTPLAVDLTPMVAGTPVARASDSAQLMADLTPNLALVERREALTATGYAVISVQSHRNTAQQRLLAIRAAKLDAYRSLAEQVYGVRLDANATVADMVVQNDTFRVRVEGVIFGAKLVSITPTGDDTYETTLSLDRAVVQDLRTLYLVQKAAR